MQRRYIPACIPYWGHSLLVSVCFLWSFGGLAQCGTTISAFPYNEGFEAGPAWTAGGAASDWAWGTPAHPLINAAGSGSRAWCIGGLSGTNYNGGQQSWLESPCFDMSGLEYPWISFKLFWECELQYDGLGFQYSLDQGSTWQNVGSVNSTQNCLQQYWFNHGSINSLNQASPKHGWSGRVGPTVGSCFGGQGSGEWVTASHCLTDLAGESSVKFRFIFGSGTTCNAYDGVAVDDIWIGEAVPNSASFAFNCDGNTVEFQSTSALCPTMFQWNFGDPGSAGENTSTSAAASHTYPGPGTYQVALTVSSACNAASTVVLPVTIIGVELAATDPGCAGNDGSITATVSEGNGPFTYTWTPAAPNTATITGLNAGSYSVVVTGAGVCRAMASVDLQQQDDPLVLTVQVGDVSCAGASDGWAEVDVQGGMGGYTYAWSPTGGDMELAEGLSTGSYMVSVTDGRGCSGTATAEIGSPEPLSLTVPAELSMCAGSTLELQAVVSGGTPPYTVTYAPEGPLVAPVETTTYTIAAVDANGCTAPDQQTLVQVGGPAPPVILVQNDHGCAPHCTTISADGNGSIAIDPGDGSGMLSGPETQHCFPAGTYTMTATVTDDLGCTAQSILEDAVTVDPSPLASFSAQPPITTVEYPDIQFTQHTQGADQWQWSFGDPDGSTTDLHSPRFSFPGVGCYEVVLEVWNQMGCAHSAMTEVCVEDELAIYVPTAFTPDSDGLNDVFRVITSVRSPRYFHLAIFDRWGRPVHETTDHEQGWDGDAPGGALPTGLYVWQLRMTDTFGTPQERKGHVMLLR